MHLDMPVSTDNAYRPTTHSENIQYTKHCDKHIPIMKPTCRVVAVLLQQLLCFSDPQILLQALARQFLQLSDQ